MTRLTRRFDAVVFDAGGVLVIPTPELFGPLVTSFGGDGSDASITRAHYAAMAAQDQHSQRDQDWLVYSRAFVVAVGVTSDRVEEAAREHLRVMDADLDSWRWPLRESVQALRVLYDAGVPMAVVSNAEGQIAETLRVQGVCQVGPGDGVPMTIVVDSHQVGVSKPDPAIFGFALEALGVAASRALYVGDSVSRDVVGARAAGLHPLHLDPYGDHPDATHDRIASLAAVVDWVR
jgi:putative hydrolase of the HAD superfamily